MGKWIPLYGQSLSVTLEATEAIAAGDPVKLATNGIAIAGDGEGVFGVAATAIASGAVGTVWLDGVYDVTFGATVVMGAPVYAAATGTVDAGTATNPAVGIVVDADVASGARGHVLLISSRMNQAVHA